MEKHILRAMKIARQIVALQEELAAIKHSIRARDGCGGAIVYEVRAARVRSFVRKGYMAVRIKQ